MCVCVRLPQHYIFIQTLSFEVGKEQVYSVGLEFVRLPSSVYYLPSLLSLLPQPTFPLVLTR